MEPYAAAWSNLQNYANKIGNPIDRLDKEPNFDDHHKRIINLTKQALEGSLHSIKDIRVQILELFDNFNIHHNRYQRSLLPLGHLFSFLFGTANQDDLNSIKSDIKTLYQNQQNQASVLTDMVSITNVSRNLINENRLLINDMVTSIVSLNKTFIELQKDLFLLFTTRKFYLMHTEILIHIQKLDKAINKLNSDLRIMEDYLTMFNTGSLNPNVIDPKLLTRELLSIQKQLPPGLNLLEDPNENIWHYYKFLSITHTTHNDKIIMLIKIPLIDQDSSLDLYKIYNLPVFHPEINKEITYQIESQTLAVSSDRNYITIPTESEFIECTLASGHFCNIRSALYHVKSSSLCVVALFLKDPVNIDNMCKLNVRNITSPRALYLDDGTWAIATSHTEQMEVTCPTHKYVESINPPLSMIKLKPACSAFSTSFKLPPYFKRFSQGFSLALYEANLNSSDLPPVDFRAWKSLDIFNLSSVQMSNLKLLKESKNIPVNILKAEIGNLKSIHLDNNIREWLFIGGGSGSGLLILVIVCLCGYFKYKPPREQARSGVNRPGTEHDGLNMQHTSVDAMGSVITHELGQETVKLQSSEKPVNTVRFADEVYDPYTLKLLNQMERFGMDNDNTIHRTSGSGSSAQNDIVVL